MDMGVGGMVDPLSRRPAGIQMAPEVARRIDGRSGGLAADAGRIGMEELPQDEMPLEVPLSPPDRSKPSTQAWPRWHRRSAIRIVWNCWNT